MPTAKKHRYCVHTAEERKRLAQMAREEVEHNDLATWIRQQLDNINALLKTRQAT